jgi:hypothetical protein
MFLKVSKEDDLLEAYERMVFEQRQFFFTKPCIPKVVCSRIERIERYRQAAELLGCETPTQSFDKHFFDLPMDSIVKLFNAYQHELNAIKHRFSCAETLHDIQRTAKTYLLLFESYSSKWPKFDIDIESALLSIEPDPVTFFQDLLQLKNEGICTFITLFEFHSPEATRVKMESNRLNYLHSTIHHASRP